MDTGPSEVTPIFLSTSLFSEPVVGVRRVPESLWEFSGVHWGSERVPVGLGGPSSEKKK